jgi:hypothetical protein
MDVGILCGVARSAQRKAVLFYDAILAVGHNPTIFSRGPMDDQGCEVLIEPSIEKFAALAEAMNLDFYIGCTDSLGDIVSSLNAQRGYDVIPPNAAHKSNLGKLSSKLVDIPTWAEIDEVPTDIPIFVKPANGSGSKGGDPWTYAKFDSIDAFKNYLTNELEGGAHRFEYAQEHTGVLGKCVFQQYIEADHSIYHHYLNDGTARHWMETKCMIPRQTSKTYFKVSNIDDYDFAHNLPFGTFGSFQAFPSEPKPLIFDFNVRASAYWNVLHKFVCPDFFVTFFDNLLNKANRKYNFKCYEFVMDPDTDGSEALIALIEDFPISGVHKPYRIIMK